MPRACSDDSFSLKVLGPNVEERCVGLGSGLLEEVLGGALQAKGDWTVGAHGRCTRSPLKWDPGCVLLGITPFA